MRSTTSARSRHVAVSFEAPEYTADVDAIGTLRLLEAIRFLGLRKEPPASIRPRRQSFMAWCRKPRSAKPRPFHPRSPYAVAKMYAYWITVNYREAYGMYACNGILFNHESPRRGETFVTRKITRGLCQHRPRSGKLPLYGQHRQPARLGPCQRLCADAVDDAAAGRARRFRDCDRRAIFGARIHQLVGARNWASRWRLRARA